MDNLSQSQMMMLLKDRYKCTEDLWEYLTKHGKCPFDKAPWWRRLTSLFFTAGYLLPSLQATRTQFLDQILKGKKKVLK